MSSTAWCHDDTAAHPAHGVRALVRARCLLHTGNITPRRGSLAGAVVVGLASMGMLVLGEALGWWRIPLLSTPFLLFLGLAISFSPIYLVTWRIARRFGTRGLMVFAGVVTIIGAPRDYFIASKFPQWMVFSPGVAPIIADAVTYGAVIVLLGHAVMRVVAGPAGEDRLARAPSPSPVAVAS